MGLAVEEVVAKLGEGFARAAFWPVLEVHEVALAKDLRHEEGAAGVIAIVYFYFTVQGEIIAAVLDGFREADPYERVVFCDIGAGGGDVGDGSFK